MAHGPWWGEEDDDDVLRCCLRDLMDDLVMPAFAWQAHIIFRHTSMAMAMAHGTIESCLPASDFIHYKHVCECDRLTLHPSAFLALQQYHHCLCLLSQAGFISNLLG